MPDPSPTPAVQQKQTGKTMLVEENGEWILMDLTVESFIDPAQGWSTQRLLNEINAETAVIVPVGQFDLSSGWANLPSDQSLIGRKKRENTVGAPVPASTSQPGGIGKMSYAVFSNKCPDTGMCIRQIVGWVYHQGIANGGSFWVTDSGGYKIEVKDRHLLKH